MHFFQNRTAPMLFKWLMTTLLLLIVVGDIEAATMSLVRPQTTTRVVPKIIVAPQALKIAKTAASTKVTPKVIPKAKVIPKVSAKTSAVVKSITSKAPHPSTHVRRVSRRPLPQASPRVREAPIQGEYFASNSPLRVSATKAIIVHEDTGETLFGKNIDHVTPIASVTKLMTAMVVLDRNLSMDEEIIIDDDDVDRIKHSSSRLLVGTVLTRRETLQLALMSSENRAAASLARTYPGGTFAFVTAMNHKAHDLGMNSSHFVDATGLNSANVSTAEDLVKMARAARRYELIHEMTTTTSHEIGVGSKKRPTLFINTNRLVRGGTWDIGLSKTGYINEAGHCLVMQVQINAVPTIVVLLGNSGKSSCPADAVRIRQWLERRHAG